MPIPRFRKRCLNAYPNRRERSQNFDNNNANPNFYNQQSTIFRQTWGGFGAVAFTLSTAPTIWTPTQKNNIGGTVVDNTDPMFDGLGNILGIRRSGLPSYSISCLKINPIVYNIDKAHSCWVENVIFDTNALSSTNPSVGITAEMDNAGSTTGLVSGNVTLADATTANLNIREGAALVATTVITNPYAGSSKLKLSVSAWNGLTRTYTLTFANAAGTGSVSFTTTVRGAAANKFPNFNLVWGNGGSTIDATVSQMAAIEYDGFAT